MNFGLTAVKGIKVGVASNPGAATGVTVVIAEDGMRAGIEVRGSAPGTRETDLLKPGQLVNEIHALVLAGGSAFGLDAASGVVRFLEEQNCGFMVAPFCVPIVSAAVLFDLFIGDGTIRPDAEMGYQACLVAGDGPVPEGSVGAGTGATVGKLYGTGGAIKTGQGSAVRRKGDLIVAALVAVNAFGDIYDADGTLLAGPLNPQSRKMEKSIDLMLNQELPGFPGNTTLGVIATNAYFEGAALEKICRMGHDGLARSIWPVHTMWDGDTIFAVSKGNIAADLTLVSLMAAEAVAEAVRRSAIAATSLGGVPALSDLHLK